MQLEWQGGGGEGKFRVGASLMCKKLSLSSIFYGFSKLTSVNQLSRLLGTFYKFKIHLIMPCFAEPYLIALEDLDSVNKTICTACVNGVRMRHIPTAVLVYEQTLAKLI